MDHGAKEDVGTSSGRKGRSEGMQVGPLAVAE